MVDELPDDVLLEIFDFYLDSVRRGPYQDLDAWHTLVHVCRRWRNVMFASPRRLDLQLVCRKDRSVRDMLDIWPALPINIEGGWERRGGWRRRGPGEILVGADNIVATLGHRDRVRSINLVVPQGKTLVAAMQVPFPELEHLELWSLSFAPPLPDSFLGGSAPRLRTLQLTNISFPAAPKLLSTASDLVDLKLDTISHSGYIPPASMVACLSSLNKLTSLSLAFDSPQSRPDQPSPPPQSRVVLPALTKFAFDGTSEYSEDLVAHIDTPVLNDLHMTFFPKPVFHVPHLEQFIGRAKGLKPSEEAKIWIHSSVILLNLRQPRGLTLGVRCTSSDLQVPSLALLCGQVSHSFSLVERLDFRSLYPPRIDVIASIEILGIFLLFAATRSLNVSRHLVPLIASALQEFIEEGATDVLPNLRDLFLEGPVELGPIQEVMQPFVDARRLSGHPVAVHYL